MAKVTGLRTWRNGEIINARDYVYERNQITTALNTNDDTLIDHENRITAAEAELISLDTRLDAAELDIDNLQAEEHLKLKYYGKAFGEITKGDVIQFHDVQGDHYRFKRAIQSEVNANPKLIMGIAYTDIANNDFGYVLDFGFLEGVDTKGFAAGTFLWFDSTGATPGAWTTTEPNGANARVLLSVIIRAETSAPANNGKLLVRVTIEPSIEEIQGISINNSQDRDILRYDASTSTYSNDNSLTLLEQYFDNHEGRTDNPHLVTQAQVGLSNVNNTSDLNKPISTATQAALDLKADLIEGKVPQSQLPSYVDDVLEVYVRAGSTEGTSNWLSLTSGGAALTPEAGKIYVIISAGDFEGKTYRWAGTVYSPVGDIALGTTAATAFPGDRGLATETQSNNIVNGTQTLTNTRITNSAVGVSPLVVNAINGTTANLQEWKVNGVTQVYLDRFYRLGLASIINTSNSNNSRLNFLTTGAEIVRNVNDTNVPLIVRKQQGTGNILELQTGTSDKKLEVDVNGWFYQNGVRFIDTNGTGNTHIGLSSGGATIKGEYNIAVGQNALSGINNAAATSNIMVGWNAGSAITSGNTNVGVGHRGGGSITTGFGNTFAGHNAGNNASQLATASNSTALGYQAYTDKSNQMVFGNASVTEFKFDRNASAEALLPRLLASASSIHKITRTSALTNEVRTPFTIRHSTSANMTDGFGTSLTFAIQDDANTENLLGSIQAVRANADNSGSLFFTTFNAGTESTKMTILPNGNVGIGTGSPARLLSLVTSSNQEGIQIRRNSATANDFATLGFRVNTSDGATNFAEIRGVKTDRAVFNDSNLSFHTFTNNTLIEAMRIRDDGLVGINETSPSAQLQVRSGATNRVGLIIDSTATTGQTANIVDFRANNGTRVSIDVDGRIYTPLGILNLSSANNARVNLETTGTTIRRNIADTNPALIVDLANSSATGNIQVWQKAGVANAWILNDGRLVSPGISNPTSGSNALMLMNTTGTTISRNVNDTNPALIVNLANSSATGNIAVFQKAGSALSYVGNNGYLYSNGLVNPTTSNTALIELANGTNISRNVADGNHALIVNNANTSSTGYIADFQFGGVTKARVENTGAIYTTNWVWAQGNFHTNGALYLNYDNSPAGSDATIYFGDDASDTAHQLYFDNSEQKFATTDGLNVTGDIGVTGTVDGVDIAAFKTSYDAHVNSEVVDFLTADDGRTSTTYTTSLEVVDLEANSIYEIEFLGSWYKEVTNVNTGIKFGVSVDNTTGTPTFTGAIEFTTNLGTLVTGTFNDIGTTVITGAAYSSSSYATSALTKRHVKIKGLLYTGTSTKTFRIETGATVAVSSGSVGVGKNSFLIARKVA